MRPKISVCMATYNGERFIREQLDSILKQLDAGDELVVSDDSSTDGTVEILKEYQEKDSRIRLFPGQKFRDPIQNFQSALCHATGEWIYLADQDDVWLENKILEINKELESYDLILHDSILTNEKLETLHPSFFRYFGSGKGILKNLIRSSYYGSCMAFRRRILDAALPFPLTKEIGHDLWLGWVAEIIGKVKLVEKPFLLYRRHTATFTPRGMGGSQRNLFQIAKGRLVMVHELFSLWWRVKINKKK